MSVLLRRVAPSVLFLSLAACSGNPFARAPEPVFKPVETDAPGAAAPASQGAGQKASAVAVGTGPAKSAEAMDTTTAAEREAAAKPAATATADLGRTIASLGDPSETGFWLRTSLVSEKTKGRVEDPSTGKTAEVELRPSGGAKGSGSQISLAAMRLLEVPLTALPELVVYRR